MCEETFFFPLLCFLREVQRHCRFLWCPEVSRPATVGWKTAPPTDSPGPAPSLQDPQDCHIAEVWNFTTDLESVKTEIVSVTSRTQSVTLFCWRENVAVTRISQLSGEASSRHPLASASLSFLSPSWFFCPGRLRPCVFARMISFQDTTGFIVFLKACGQRITSKGIQDESLLSLGFGFFKLLWKSKVACVTRKSYTQLHIAAVEPFIPGI